jgi:hypothetical protein
MIRNCLDRHDAAWLNHVGDEPVQGDFGQVGNASQTNTADPFSVSLSGDDDYSLGLRQPSIPAYAAYPTRWSQVNNQERR